MMTDDEFLKRLLDEERNLPEGDDFLDEKSKYEKVNTALEMSSQFSVPTAKSKEQAWSELKGKLDLDKLEEEQTQVIPLYRKRKFSLMAVAASLALLIGVYVIFFQTNETIFETGNAKTLTFKLPDNSSVTLNADSKISFSEDDWNESRKVLLDGEAFFEVKKGNTFSVISDDKAVNVLGTSFNIKSRNSQYQVACFTGEVAVKLATETVMLKKGEATSLVKNRLSEPFDFEKKKIKGWKIGKFYFEEVRLQDVFNEFERQYNVRLDYNAEVAARIYSGYFSNKNIEDALQLICDPMRLSYKDHGNGSITIK